jgi:hypothetical protein
LPSAPLGRPSFLPFARAAVSPSRVFFSTIRDTHSSTKQLALSTFQTSN